MDLTPPACAPWAIPTAPTWPRRSFCSTAPCWLGLPCSARFCRSTPPRLPDLSKKQVLIAAGRRDPYAEHDRVEALADRLTRAGAAVDLRWSDADHSLMPSDFKAVADWIAKW